MHNSGTSTRGCVAMTDQPVDLTAMVASRQVRNCNVPPELDLSHEYRVPSRSPRRNGLCAEDGLGHVGRPLDFDQRKGVPRASQDLCQARRIKPSVDVVSRQSWLELESRPHGLTMGVALPGCSGTGRRSLLDCFRTVHALCAVLPPRRRPRHKGNHERRGA